MPDASFGPYMSVFFLHSFFDTNKCFTVPTHRKLQKKLRGDRCEPATTRLGPKTRTSDASGEFFLSSVFLDTNQ
jgi:hypothetical protein